jgi:mono/diheme cytochrome c family protein
VVWIASGGSLASADEKVDFARDIQPIFQNSCVECHGTQKQKGGLRLDSRAAAMKGGTTGTAIIAGKGADSLLVHRIKGIGDDPRMPEKKPALPDTQIALISRWIDQGADWPETGSEVVATTHWSFKKPIRPVEPTVKNATWTRNAIDRFILARLEKQGLAPSPEAAKETLLRRVHLDLTGIPPTTAEIDAFVADKSPDAYEKVVDQLLASPAYGERWAKHWLDEARYADSNGYSIDAPREMWRWRQWVIDAINRDEPFDQFTIDQLAGDLLPNATLEQKIATGFHRNTMINQEGGIDPEQFRVEAVIDRVNTTGSVWLGLTVGCAQCHNHKFDPISQKDYYRLMAFLNNQDEPTLRLQPQQPAPGDAPTKADELTYQIEQAEIALDKLKGATSKEDQTKAAALKKQIASLKKQEAKLGSGTFVLEERKTPRESFLFIKGDFTRHGEPVTPGTLSALPPLKAKTNRPPNRLDLAKWLVDPENPLTARVTINRMWMQLFGVGIVETENDFGTQGTPPTNPELLDWLATEFLRDGWSQKKLLRSIVTSATYRQSSMVRKDLLEADPLNKLLARQNRVRLDAEIVRDVSLSAAGLLVQKLGGPSVFPPQPEGVNALGQVKREWKVSTGPDRYRRGMYTFLYRATPHPLLSGFDAPDGQFACTRRIRSNTPLQALTLLNDDAFVEAAQSLAKNVLEEKADDAAQIAKMFRLCTGRTPDAEESKILTKLLAKERTAFATEKDPEQQAWTIVARAVLNLDETITRE